MNHIVHLNCGILETSLGRACCHCVAVIKHDMIALVDTGIGLQDCLRPDERLGRMLIDEAGFTFDPERTALRQLKALGHGADRVTDVVLTHADPDHTGGLADFPEARVHISSEELVAVQSDDTRYQRTHFAHGPHWVEHHAGDGAWQGIPSRTVTVCDDVELQLVELPGHTAGHCGVAVPNGKSWLLHAGDAYYLRDELNNPDHPVKALAEFRAQDNDKRVATLEVLRRLSQTAGASVEMTGYHDEQELLRFSANRGMG